MRPIHVRELTREEQGTLQKGLRSSSAFTVRRCQIILSSAQGRTSSQIAAQLHCSDQTVRNAIWSFELEGLSCLKEKSHARHDQQSAFNEVGQDRLREIIRLSPRTLGHESSVWTLDMLAESCWQERLVSRPVSGDNVGYILRQMGISWRRAKHWIRSPDEHYAHRKKDEAS
jgi:transposase